MFKKKDQVALAPSHLVSGADRKKLGRRAAEAFSLTTDQIGVLLPPKAQLGLARFAPPSRAALYTLDGEPWLLDARAGRRDDLLPTVLALWRLPSLLPALPVRHSAVSRFLISGADLMVPGVDPEAVPLDLQQRAAVAIVVPGNPAPLAVGRMLMSGEALKAAAGGKGRAVELLHCVGDLLWALAPGSPVPNPGYTGEEVQPWSGPDMTDLAAAAASLGAMKVTKSLPGGSAFGVAPATSSSHEDSEGRQSPTASQPSSSGIARVLATGPPELSNGEAVARSLGVAASERDAVADAEAPKASLEQMDALLQETLLQALATSVKDKALPMTGAALWAGHILPSRRAVTTLELKASSHKKLSKLLQAHGQAGSKLLTVREGGAAGDVMVTSVDRRHPLLTGHRPWSPDECAGSAPPPPPPAGASVSGSPPLTIQEQYKARPELTAVFVGAGADPKGTYTAQEAGEVAVRYAQAARLEQKASSPSHILLDPILCDALYKGILKKGTPFPTELPKSQLRGTFLVRMLPQMLLTRGGVTTVLKGSAQLEITTEKRRNNKKVTRVVGFEAFLLDAHTLAADLRRHFAASATVAPLPGEKAKGHEIAVQGEVVEKMVAYLMSAHGIPKQHINAKLPNKKGGGASGNGGAGKK